MRLARLCARTAVCKRLDDLQTHPDARAESYYVAGAPQINLADSMIHLRTTSLARSRAAEYEVHHQRRDGSVCE